MSFPNTYSDWLQRAATAGIDWDNPPPQNMITEELCLADLQDAPGHLEKMPEDMKTFDVCFTAVYYDEDSLQYVPENMRTAIMERKNAISSDEWLSELSCWTGNHYLKLPSKLLTPDFCKAMVECNAYTIDLIPESLRTPEIVALSKVEDPFEKWFHNLSNSDSMPIVKGGTQLVMENS
jgi:hypothetical protein